VPDATWSPWQGLSGNLIGGPDGRYLQYRAVLSTTNPALTPALESVTIHYLAGCSAEICNGLDDNCDGQVDEDGEILCDDKNPCTTDACVDGQCSHTPTPDATCDDGSARAPAVGVADIARGAGAA